MRAVGASGVHVPAVVAAGCGGVAVDRSAGVRVNRRGRVLVNRSRRNAAAVMTQHRAQAPIRRRNGVQRRGQRDRQDDQPVQENKEASRHRALV